MKKVAFSISNVRSKSDKKLSGFGSTIIGKLQLFCWGVSLNFAKKFFLT